MILVIVKLITYTYYVASAIYNNKYKYK